MFEKDLTPYDWNDKTVLIVEDEELNNIYFEELLSLTGINILMARSGKEALEIVQNTPSIDIILMDIKMPVMDGFEATEKIKAMNPDIPVIAQTAHALSAEKRKCFEVGCNDYIAKPIDGDELFKLMDKYFI